MNAHSLVHLNAALNFTAAVLLVVGYVLIKQRREAAHQSAMLAAFFVSAAFLVSYLIYHYQVGSVKFTHSGPAKFVYFPLLLSHVLLAFTVVPLALATIYFGLKSFGWWLPQNLAAEELPAYLMRNRVRHRRVAWWTFPIWLYVSITGVIVYVMLYHLYPPVANGL